MKPTRTFYLAAAGVTAVVCGAAAQLAWPNAKPAIDCAPELLRWTEGGVALCGPGGPVPAAAALTLGIKLDLNLATEADLALLPGVGPSLARTIVRAREQAAFASWEAVDRVAGIGPAKLEVLQSATRIGDTRKTSAQNAPAGPTD